MIVIQDDPNTMTVDVKIKTCEFHKNNPGKTSPNCTCSGTYSYRKKTKEEIKQGTADNDEKS